MKDFIRPICQFRFFNRLPQSDTTMKFPELLQKAEVILNA